MYGPTGRQRHAAAARVALALRNGRSRDLRHSHPSGLPCSVGVYEGFEGLDALSPGVTSKLFSQSESSGGSMNAMPPATGPDCGSASRATRPPTSRRTEVAVSDAYRRAADGIAGGHCLGRSQEQSEHRHRVHGAGMAEAACVTTVLPLCHRPFRCSRRAGRPRHTAAPARGARWTGQLVTPLDVA